MKRRSWKTCKKPRKKAKKPKLQKGWKVTPDRHAQGDNNRTNVVELQGSKCVVMLWYSLMPKCQCEKLEKYTRTRIPTENLYLKPVARAFFAKVVIFCTVLLNLSENKIDKNGKFYAAKISPQLGPLKSAIDQFLSQIALLLPSKSYFFTYLIALLLYSQ